jgi:RNA polymerase sigma factor (sigma-70 family)
MKDPDQILLYELKKGSKIAYEMVFKKYYKALAMKAFLMLDDEAEAEDVVQNLFVSMWEKAKYDSVNTSLKAYLFRATHNQCLTVLRNKKVAGKRADSYAIAVDDDEELTENEIENKVAQINLVFNALPPQRQKAFKLVYLDDKKYKDAAKEMGLSVNSLKTHLKFAVKILQKKLINIR